MRVSNITPNVSFKRVTKQAASHALNEAKKENSLWSTQDVNSLIGKGFASTCYDVGFNKESGKYTVYRNNERPRGTTMLLGGEKEVESLAEAVNLSLQKQQQQNEYLTQIAKTMDEANVLGLFTVKDIKK